MKSLVAVVSFAIVVILAIACGGDVQPAATPTAAVTPSPTAEATAAPSPTAAGTNFFEWIDDHSGSVVALATVALVVITAGYVILTQRLVRGQHLGTKREIIEKIYTPISERLDEVVWGSWPRLRIWDELKEQQPFLAFHHLIPNGIRDGLNELNDTWAKSGQAAHRQLADAIDDISARFVGETHRTGTAGFSFTIGSDGWSVPLFKLILTNKGISEAAASSKLDSAEGQILLDPRVVGISHERRTLDAGTAMRLLHDIVDELEADDSLGKLLIQHRALLEKAEGIHQRIRREIEKGSRV